MILRLEILTRPFCIKVMKQLPGRYAIVVRSLKSERLGGDWSVFSPLKFQDKSGDELVHSGANTAGMFPLSTSEPAELRMRGRAKRCGSGR